MAVQLTADDGRQSLNAHVAERGDAIRAKYGPHIGWTELQRILQDCAFVRYPCDIVFDAGPLQPGEFAHPVPRGDSPEEGFNLYVHPWFMLRPDRIPYLALYQLVLVNYGAFASADDAETFGACALGLSKEEYYRIVCELADEIDPAASA
jgi:hypothetical protein